MSNSSNVPQEHAAELQALTHGIVDMLRDTQPPAVAVNALLSAYVSYVLSRIQISSAIEALEKTVAILRTIEADAQAASPRAANDSPALRVSSPKHQVAEFTARFSAIATSTPNHGAVLEGLITTYRHLAEANPCCLEISADSARRVGNHLALLAQPCAEGRH